MANDKDPVDWFKDDIWMDYQDFLADPSERKARHVAISLRHFPERVYKVYSKTNLAKLGGATSPNDLVNQLASQCPELLFVKAAAEPSKHHFPDSNTRPKAPLTTATDAIYTDSNGKVRIGGSINLSFRHRRRGNILEGLALRKIPPKLCGFPGAATNPCTRSHLGRTAWRK